jgi:hypothetical protein
MNATETTGKARTETRTYKGVTTTSTEVRRTRFYGTLDGHWNVGHDRRNDIGPCIVEVVVWRHEESTGRGPLDDSFSVEIDGTHQWGGFARHMTAGDRPAGLERLSAVEPECPNCLGTGCGDCGHYLGCRCGERENCPPRMPSATCPRCGRVTHHPKDIETGYCAACHDYTNPTQALANMLRGKVHEAMAAGATEDEAIAAVRALWLEAVRGK